MNKVLAALVPPGVVTKTLAGLALPAGVVAVIRVELTTVTLVAGVPSMVTDVASPRLVPVRVMLVPPAVDPAAGEMAVTVGALAKVTCWPMAKNRQNPRSRNQPTVVRLGGVRRADGWT